MDKGVVNPVTSGAPDTAESADGAEPTRTLGSGLHRRRRRKRHHRHQNLNKRSGKGIEIAFVTLVAIGLLFGVIYFLIEGYQHRNNGDETGHLSPLQGPPRTIEEVARNGGNQGRVLRREPSTGA